MYVYVYAIYIYICIYIYRYVSIYIYILYIYIYVYIHIYIYTRENRKAGAQLWKQMHDHAIRKKSPGLLPTNAEDAAAASGEKEMQPIVSSVP